MEPEKTGALISECRKEKGLTQRDIAELLNISNRTVSKWENGDGFPDTTLLPQIAEILEITTDELLAGERKEKEEQKILFEAQIDNSLKGLKRVFKIRARMNRPIWYDIIFTICIVLAIAVSGYCISKLSYTVHYRFSIIFFVVMLVVYYFNILVLPNLTARLNYIANKTPGGDHIPVATLTLTEDGKFILKNERTQSLYYPSEITDIVVKDNMYIIQIGKGKFTYLLKDSFTVGDCDEFFNYISSNIPQKNNKKKQRQKTYYIIAITALVSVTLIATTILSAIANSNKYYSYDDYINMSTEELAELDDYDFEDAIYCRIDNKIEKNIELNEYEKTVSVLDYFSDFVTVLSEDETRNMGLCYYLFYTDLTDLNELYKALDDAHMPMLSESIKEFIEENNIDIMDFNSKADYDELYKKYHFEEFDKKMESNYQLLNDAIVLYKRDNVSKF